MERSYKMIDIKEKTMEIIFFICALVSILAVLLISVFLIANGVPTISKIGFFDFVFSSEWSPTDIPAKFGIFPMILGSIYITIGSIIIGVPIGVLTALFIAKICSKNVYKFLKPSIDLLSGIPSVVYGFFGMISIVPIFGNSIVSASILLGIMILPTIISISQTSISSVAEEYYQGALALGSGKYRALFYIVIPAAKSGIIASIVLGIGRAIGETMAVIMVAGNQARMPISIFKGVRTLTANIVIEMGYAADFHKEALIATGVILMVFIFTINTIFLLLKRRNSV